jgi:hypothetical protein
MSGQAAAVHGVLNSACSMQMARATVANGPHSACSMQPCPWAKGNNLFNTQLLQKLQNCYKHKKNVSNPYKNRVEKNKSS